MMVIYDRQTKELVSFAGQIFDNGEWREPTLAEIYPGEDHGNWDVVYVKEAIKYAIPLNELQLKYDQNGTPIGVERKPKPPQIFITTNAPDTDGDGLPEIPADASSKAAIAIEVKDSTGNLVQQELPLNISTTAGSLSARRLSTQNGQATVELTSSQETVTAIVKVESDGAQSASLTFEFMPIGA
ncbi:MAG: Ig-like domain-containing protein [Goleter apudmare HA4340-LM2]|jgi:hypothetical protein|nr:Ig-like domain-containing protein [Goleter apudmare HA4340-LM2]